MRYATVVGIAFALNACDEAPTALLQLGQVTVSAGFSHTCALNTAGGAYCWGNNRNGQLGVGSSDTLPHATPLAVSGAPQFAAISAGGGATCALTPAGTAYCWGDGAMGALGTGDTLTRKTPSAVAGGHQFVSITVGTSHACALTTNGTAYCWGQGIYGQLGNSSNVNSNVPSPVAGGLTFTTISAGETHTCGTAGGVAYCWGINVHGALGSGNVSVIVQTPTTVSGGQSFTSVSAGFRYTCGTTISGATLCWGLNLWGELGVSTPNSCLGFSDDFFPCSMTPALVRVNAAASVAVNQSHTCARTPVSEIYCWGTNWSGQIGSGSIVERLPPTKIFGAFAYSRVSVGGMHTCGVTDTQQVYCWGGNTAGQVGDGSTTSRNAPVLVTLP